MSTTETKTPKKLHAGDTVSRYYYFKDKSGAAVNPDTTTVTITNPNGTPIAPSPTLSAVITGKYELNYNLASNAPTGAWRIAIKGVKGTYSNTEYFAFYVYP